MGRVIDRIEIWLWRHEQQRRERQIQRHFANVRPDSVWDIDKYLRDHGLAP